MLGARFAFAITLILLALLVMFNGVPGNVSSNVRDPYGLVGLYVEYECPLLTLINRYNMYDYYGLYRIGPPSAILLAKYYDSELYKSIVDKWGDEIIRFNRNRNAVRDPLLVTFYLEDLYMRLEKAGYTFHYNLSFHVVGFDGVYYDVVLRFGFSIVHTRNLSYVLYRSPFVEEFVKVSARDRSMVYKGSYAGFWPFFLLPWEVYEGSNVVLSDMVAYKVFDVKLPIDRVNATLKSDVSAWHEHEILRRIWENRKRYFKEVVGIDVRSESILSATIIFNISDIQFYKEWLFAEYLMARRFYESLGFTYWPIGPKSPDDIRVSISGSGVIPIRLDYDVKTGVAVYLQLSRHLPLDPLLYVIPVWGSYDVGGDNCPAWILRSLKYVAPPVVTTAYATDTGVTTVQPTGVVGDATSATSPTTATTVGVGVTQAITQVNATTPTATASPTVIVRTPTTIQPPQPPGTPVQAIVTPTPPPLATPAQPPRGSILSLELVLVAATLIIAVSLIALYLRTVRR
jgi:hypothetical protein